MPINNENPQFVISNSFVPQTMGDYFHRSFEKSKLFFFGDEDIDVTITAIALDTTSSFTDVERTLPSGFSSEDKKKGKKCRVDTCQVTLTDESGYRKRRSICKQCMFDPELVVRGELMRYCQQCSRLECLDEFEGHRRSCRKSLEKHRKSIYLKQDRKVF